MDFKIWDCHSNGIILGSSNYLGIFKLFGDYLELFWDFKNIFKIFSNIIQTGGEDFKPCNFTLEVGSAYLTNRPLKLGNSLLNAQTKPHLLLQRVKRWQSFLINVRVKC